MAQNENKYKESMKQLCKEIDKPVAKVTKKNQRGSRLIKRRKGSHTTDIEEIQRLVQIYLKNLHSTKLENVREMDKLLDMYV